MLIEFTAGNYRSIKEPVTLSMVASNLKSKDSSIDEKNTFEVDNKLRLLTSTSIFGANASGKSNLIDAILFMQSLVLFSSSESRSGEQIGVVPFRLNQEFQAKPSFFEMVFLVNKTIHRYGFEVNNNEVLSEWCYYSPKGREAMIFSRQANDIKIGRSMKASSSLRSLTRPNALFLSVATQFNNKMAKDIYEWFSSLIVLKGLGPVVKERTENLLLNDEYFHNPMKKLIISSDLGISEIVAEKVILPEPTKLHFPDDMPEEVKDYFSKMIKENPESIAVQTVHTTVDKNGKTDYVKFDLDDESDGTQRLFYMSGPVVDSLRNSRVLIVDEMDLRLHTLLTKEIINLFNSKETNPNHAQLVFTSHDTNLLDKEYFRRDQIWLIEKDVFGASHLYSLAELNIRNDASFESDYLHGKYGGLPNLSSLAEGMAREKEEYCA